MQAILKRARKLPAGLCGGVLGQDAPNQAHMDVSSVPHKVQQAAQLAHHDTKVLKKLTVFIAPTQIIVLSSSSFKFKIIEENSA